MNWEHEFDTWKEVHKYLILRQKVAEVLGEDKDGIRTGFILCQMMKQNVYDDFYEIAYQEK